MKKLILTVVFAFISCITFANNTHEINPKNLSDINWEKKEDLNSFCKAIMKGDAKMVQQLIEFGEDVNKKSLGKTPAMFAARYNKVEVLKLLVKNGADLSMKSDKTNYTVKKFAELSNAKETLDYLVSLEK